MRTTLSIDDELLKQAQYYMQGTDKTALVREGLRALVERESSRRLALLGGTEKKLQAAPRRRAKAV